MFDLVADVEHYPQFVPLCRSLRVRKRTEDGEGREVIVADMTVAYKLIRETFTSRVTLDRPKLEILVEYLEGPFSKMNNRWSFRAEGEDACEVEFFIAYEFRSRTLGMLMGRCSTPPSAASPRPSSAAPIRFTARSRLKPLPKARQSAVA